MPEPAVAIGLEAHAELLTKSKMFCRCECAHGGRPNTRVCPVCLGLPGALPYPNERAIELGVTMGVALDCRINGVSVFARKNYFYPDLPKGYQISQYEIPLCEGGRMAVEVGGRTRNVALRRVHLEEDAGKSLHDAGDKRGSTGVDMNRCGVPLIEIVSEPVLESPEEAVACLEYLRQLMRYLDVCDGDMEKGSLRCDVNVSVARPGAEGPGANTEIKNLNSFKAVERSLRFEIARQSAILDGGGSVKRETLLWDEASQSTAPMRAKEGAQDYRYFPEPDLPPLVVPQGLVERVRTSLPEAPRERMERFKRDFALPAYDAAFLTSRRSLADYFEACVRAGAAPKAAANWLMTEMTRAAKEKRTSVASLPVPPRSVASLLRLVREGTISGTAAKSVLAEMLRTGEEAEDAVARLGLGRVLGERKIAQTAAAVVRSEPAAVEAYLGGKTEALEYLMGAVMRATGGRARPAAARDALLEALDLERGSPGE